MMYISYLFFNQIMGFETVLLKTFNNQFISFASNKGKVVSEEDAGTKFIEEPKSDGRILFSDINNKNRVIDGYYNTNEVGMYDRHEKDNQVFKLRFVGQGYFNIYFIHNNIEYCFIVKNSLLKLDKCNNTNNEKFMFDYVNIRKQQEKEYTDKAKSAIDMKLAEQEVTLRKQFEEDCKKKLEEERQRNSATLSQNNNNNTHNKKITKRVITTATTTTTQKQTTTPNPSTPNYPITNNFQGPF